ncbi:MAG: SLBB domain-containing protein [Armatimonadetes bacterium]|nr:SLBB domain-containing protein [Armatimonadota bacterium]
MPEVKILRKWVHDPEQHRMEVALSRGYYQAARQALTEMKPDEIINLVRDSGVRGRGGAGASCGMKWGFMPKEPTPQRPNYLICNCDESEPGTFSNRELVEYDPHQLIEAIVISAYALRVRTALIYCRGEFLFGYERLNEAVQEARERGFVGEKIFGTDFSLDIIVHRGAGAYICGEETALMDSLEGKRGHPRAKPPFPANVGLYGMPTTINNVETLCNIPHLINHGLEWFWSMGTAGAPPEEPQARANWIKSLGTRKSTGTKILSVSGHVKRPGNYEVVMGTSLRELIYDVCGGICGDHDLKAVIPGGSSMPMIPKPIAMDVQMAFETLQAAGTALGSGGVIVFDDQTDIPQVCLAIARFYKNESCGKCVPCRIGTDWIYKLIQRIVTGQGRMEDIELIRDVCINLGGERMMDSRSYCPLGDAAAWPIIWGGLKYFQHEFEHYIRYRRSPVGAEPALVGAH